jgi:hypothetical protein
MMLFGHVFVRSSKADSDNVILNHELIHVEQWKELTFAMFTILNVPFIGSINIRYTILTMICAFCTFYVWYFLEYLLRLVIKKNHDEAYMSISFEKEAYLNEGKPKYLSNRDYFSFIKYL